MEVRTFDICVKTRTGKTLLLQNVNSSITIYTVKIMVQRTEKFPVNELRFIFSGKKLENDRNLKY